MARGLSLCLWLSLSACSSAATEPSTINPMLERWCDGHPCGWDVDGEFKKIGTWHPNDYAVELTGGDARLSQLRAELSASRANCFAFSLMAQLSEQAHAYFELDFLDDGVIEFSQRIPRSDWQVRTFTIATPTWYQGVRFIVRKSGPEPVIVAELNVELATHGCSTTPLPLLNRPNAAGCERAPGCAADNCNDGGTCD